MLRVVDTPDLSPDIKQYGALDEQQIMREAAQLVLDFFDSTISTDFESKWDEGSKEHGALTLEKLYEVDWTDQMLQECKDLFWYQTIRRFKLYREGNLLPGEPYPPTR